MTASTSTPSSNTGVTLTMDELLEMIEKTDLPAGIKAKITAKPYLLMQVMEALGHMRLHSIEGNRVYAFLLIVDRSYSVNRFVTELVRCIAGTFETLKTIKVSGTIVGGCVAITDEVQGGEVLVPFAPASRITIDPATFPFHPGGVTPLHDTVVVALVALRVLARMMVDLRKKLVPMAYIVSDGEDYTEGTPEFTGDEAAAMVSCVRTGRLKGRVAGAIVCEQGYDLTDSFTRLGIPVEAIRQIGLGDTDALEELFVEISRSVESTSQSGETGGF